MKTLLLGLALPDSYDDIDPEDIASLLAEAINFARHAGERYPDKVMVSLFPAPQWLDAEVLDRLRHWASTPVPPAPAAPPADEPWHCLRWHYPEPNCTADQPHHGCQAHNARSTPAASPVPAERRWIHDTLYGATVCTPDSPCTDDGALCGWAADLIDISPPAPAETDGASTACNFSTGRCVYDDCTAAGRCLAPARRPAETDGAP